MTIKSKVYIDFKDIGKQIQKAVQVSLHETGKEYKQITQTNALKPKTGILYPSMKNRSSSPKETSARQSGFKVDNTVYKIKKNQGIYGTRDIVDYAEYLEYGTKHMEARKDNLVALTEASKGLQDKVDLKIKNILANYK